ncbi:MAG: prolyl oligopeptidase family serine peptidase [Proteobacteria bacterium]|nr:prolyl oligopeptidase family serine peptidase [Pseudomonadota bacterium]
MSGQKQHKTHSPTITEMISLEVPNLVKISPDGQKVAYTIEKTNWKENVYEKLCYIYDRQQKKSFPLTQTGVVSQLEWIDACSLAVLKVDPIQEKERPQVWFFENLVGEAWQVTDEKEGVTSFKVFAHGLLYLCNQPGEVTKKKRIQSFGNFVHFEQEQSSSALYYLDLDQLRLYHRQMKSQPYSKEEIEKKKKTKPVVKLCQSFESPLAILDFFGSPKGDCVYLNCRSKDDLVYVNDTSVFQLKFNPAQIIENHLQQKGDQREQESLKSIALPKSYLVAEISPDGDHLLIQGKERDQKSYTQKNTWILDVKIVEDSPDQEGVVKNLQKIDGKLDRELHIQKWTSDGIFATYMDGVGFEAVRITKESKVQKLDFGNLIPSFSGFDVAENGTQVFIGQNETSLAEVFIIDPNRKKGVIPITNLGKTAGHWKLGTAEKIVWESRDGVSIEGVLRKPTNYDPSLKYPLFFIIHGGPAWISEMFLLSSYQRYYPYVQFLNKGALTLEVNYRGSLGRGQEFLELNKENLGIGDLWDLESAIDFLHAKKMINKEKIGCMGWSQGGYISAFAGIHSDHFQAVSVGAGIPSWYSYYVTTDTPDFTKSYLSGTPTQNKELYEKTAPISKITQAKTPTLIQHGEGDARAPVSCAKELYRRLQEVDVPVELFIYPDMEHRITRPKENRAIMYQNLNWFSHYIFGEELDLIPESAENI